MKLEMQNFAQTDPQEHFSYLKTSVLSQEINYYDLIRPTTANEMEVCNLQTINVVIQKAR